jgi:hypothetical protein
MPLADVREELLTSLDPTDFNTPSRRGVVGSLKERQRLLTSRNIASMIALKIFNKNIHRARKLKAG